MGGAGFRTVPPGTRSWLRHCGLGSPTAAFLRAILHNSDLPVPVLQTIHSHFILLFTVINIDLSMCNSSRSHVLSIAVFFYWVASIDGFSFLVARHLDSSSSVFTPTSHQSQSST